MAGIKIKELLLGEMKRSGLSARGLALKMNLPPQSINNWIDSNIHPNAKSLNAIAAYFRVKPGDLIDDPGDPTSMMGTPQNRYHADPLAESLMMNIDTLRNDLTNLAARIDAQGRHIDRVCNALDRFADTGDRLPLKRLRDAV